MELLPSDVESKGFDVVRRGYDPAEVRAYLQKVAAVMSGLEERAKIATVRAERMERKLLDTERGAEVREDHGDRTAAFDAHEIIAKARTEAETIEAHAREVLDRAMAASDRIEHETAEIRSAAEAEADRVLAEARQRAARMEAEADADRRWVAALVDRQRRADGDQPDEVAVVLDADDVTIDLSNERQAVSEAVRAEPRTSRYMSRSANLPHLGEDAGSILGDMTKVRGKDA